MISVLSGLPLQSRRRPARAGFTLIELLVCIAIVGLLIALLIPSLRAARERSKLTTCLSNVRSIALAANCYAGEFDGFYQPFTGTYIDSNTIGWTQFWFGSYNETAKQANLNYGYLNPYIRSAKAILCPSAPPEMTSYDYKKLTKVPLPVTPYAFYDNVIGLRTNKLMHPANTVMMGETGTVTYGGNVPTAITTPMEMLDCGSCLRGCPNLLARHNQFGAVAWADGHATAERPYFPNPSDLTTISSSPSTQLYITQEPFGYLTPVPQSVAFADVLTRLDTNAYFWLDGLLNPPPGP